MDFLDLVTNDKATTHQLAQWLLEKEDKVIDIDYGNEYWVEIEEDVNVGVQIT